MRQVTRLKRPRFIVDSMLGSLARWLRMIGYDTVYAKGWHDSRILEEAATTGRIVVTRDRGLYRRALRRGLTAVLVSEDLAYSLALLSLKFGVELSIDPNQSRCPLCNAPLRPASKEEVRGRVPPRVYEAYDEFWVCTGCSQVYWRGGHWRGIRETLEEARKKLQIMMRRSSDRGPQHG
ncbi:Mut7-C RNAse domain-containing protein [Hyperthermus butylicus]|uniref:Conserved archaeal protein n=1 Tax=Hyperthermus butylicus (strain DSM 5456 / JCM 9403 / PLM1-5) TaxID=415426 RepID=A2BLX6_HYPBU|nr:Mut7-C RNAse domain-containing protein [Hyperthermus butylicus]ABM80987.1 conserved archaeal protein [Hyperthermus butylicus DSM 5456]